MRFCYFEAFREIHREVLFLVKKVTISEKSTEILRKFVFLNKFEKKENPDVNLDLFKHVFDQISKRRKY